MPAPVNDEAHQQLLESLDIALVPRPFKNSSWKPSGRRNKNIKQIVGEAARREAASVLATQNNSGSNTPALTATASSTDAAEEAGTSGTHGTSSTNIAQAAQNLSTLVLERNLHAAAAAAGATLDGSTRGTTTNGGQAMVNGSTATPQPATVADSGFHATYTNIESAPSLHPAHQRPYCDITGLSGPYMDPKTRLRYHDKEVFGVVRTLPQGVVEQYLTARGAHVILK